VVMAITMPQLNGIEATRQIVAKFPQSKVIVFSSQSSRQFIEDMLSAGAAGYLLKESTPEELLQGIRVVSRGEMYLSKAITGTVLEAYVERISGKQLDNRQREDVAILRTKLHQPPNIPDLVPRMRLTDHLNAGQVKPLILISAPAGYGKSILVSSWLATCGWPSGWVSLDQSDSDIRQFLRYFVAAVRDIFPNVCEQTLIMANAPQLPSTSTLAETLSNELGEIEKPFILVLDDYYRIDTKSPVNDLIYHLLERPPLPLHLVIVTRRDPFLQLVTLRAGDQVTEVRSQDLCFTRAETKALLENAATFSADDDTLDDLDREVEGWAVGLRLVSQVLRSREHQEDFLQNLHRGVQQTNTYLLQEVFARQSPELQHSLLQSSILDRFCAPLCEAIYHADTDHMLPEINGERFIDELTEGNLFVIPLDSHGKWFRFHHLFQQLLQHELTKRMSSDEIADLHVRAGQWFESQNFIDEAIEHLLAAGDTVGAAEIIEQRHWLVEQETSGWRSLERWLSILPAEIKKKRPHLLLTQIWSRHNGFQMEEIASILQQLELIDMEDPLDETCMGALKLFQGTLHYWAGDGKVALNLLLEARKIIPEEHSRMTGLNEIYLSLTCHMAGQGEASLQKLNKAIQNHDQLDKVFLARLVLARALSYTLSGELTSAVQDVRWVSDIWQRDSILMQGWGSYLEASNSFRLNNLQAALEHFSVAVQYRYSINTRVALDSMIGLALTHQAMGQSDTATDTMAELLHFAREIGHSKHLAVAQSGQARLALAQGDLDLATGWLKSFDEKPSAVSMFIWLENPAITQARVLLAIGSPESLEQANKMLASLQQEIEALHNTCQLIEIMVLQVLALEKLGYGAEAFTAL
ncbi:MAG: response regulator, partial [Deltaproteobacteria bacterium]|nr:response regulator [Deltaproteobacteria bacterium]